MSNLDYFDLSILSVENIQPLKDFVKKVRNQNGDASFKAIWKDPSLQIDISISKDHPALNSGIAGAHVFNRRSKEHNIVVRNFGSKQKNAYHHRGGFTGTIIHEWCHAMQVFNATHGIGEWFWDQSHPQQDALYERYRGMCDGFYAAVSPEEMAAEAFRVLNGFCSSELWEKDKNFLADWKDFFTSDEVFALHFNSRSKS